MLKIVDVHQSATINGEYLVLQNQGLTTISLRGWVVASDAYACGDPHEAADEMYVFVEDIPIKPYTRVVLFTGPGEDGWYPTNDGKRAYLAFWGHTRRVWSTASRVVLLQPACSRRIGIAVEVPTQVSV
jgi:hypothetical protein